MDDLLLRFRWEISLAIGGLILLGLGVGWWRMGGAGQEQAEILSAAQATEEQDPEKMVVDVAGAVVNPGVYELESGSRVGQAIAAAGGWAEGADTKWIEMYLNMAGTVQDGQKIYIPRAGEQQTGRQGGTSGGTESSRININSATQTELESLPGVGPVTAGKIMQARPYGRVEELAERKVVSAKVWDGIKELVSVW